MQKNVITLTILSALGSPTVVLADEAVDLGEIEIVQGSDASESTSLQTNSIYESYDPLDSGTSVITEETIKNSKPGGIDTTQLLKTMPFVQMDNSLDDATQENIQDIRPQNFSISGGNYYDNNIQIDGVSATSIHDVTDPSGGDLDWNNVTGQTSQSLYVTPDLLGDITVLDSNISAEYGDFVGGVVNYEIRKPKKEFGFSISTGYQNDSMVDYHEPTNLDEDEEVDSPPDFTKTQTTVSFDLPLTEKLSVLTSYSYSQSDVTYQRDEDYGGEVYGNSDSSENFLIKGVYEYRDDLTFEAQIMHSPYESERERANAIDDLIVSNSSGTQGYLSATGYFDNTDWSSKFSVMHNDASREAENVRYQWDGDELDWCYTSSSCYQGGIGSLDQLQTDYTWGTSFSTTLESGTINYGAEVKYTDASKARPEDVYYYYSAKLSENEDFICDPDDSSCTPEMATWKQLKYDAYDADVGVYSHALWSEYITQVSSVEMRAGARYSYDNFLNNHNIAPRLSANWEFMQDTYLTLGANRYFSNKMIGYAIKEQVPSHTCYQRDMKDENGDWGGEVGDWYECSSQPSTDQYSNSDLDTPYSDELTAAITIPTMLEGNLRFKTVYRQGKDQFAQSDELEDADGNEYYEMTNNGETEYIGYSIEWSGRFEKHFFNANVTWSETKNNGLIDYSSDPEDEAELIYYKGQITSMADMWEDDARQNYAAPFRASVSWSSMWFDDRLMTNATLYHRGSYEYLDDTGDNYYDEDGSRYDIYDVEKASSVTSVDLNATYQFLKYGQHNAFVDVKVKNLFSDVSGSATNYQIGRTYWIGLQYSM
ncbi:TonB-dependent receptor plug domain-containing protein [Vibrio hippocampi]|uniref:TonB-dependent receptor plug domain-containing protein n=1 Tax=Vibrio hippocampi TaxID=654686 RepID=A0ABM8ZKZ3_9VIBR|nr:TonB-dependent receptor plug domain-containing protein [Vibrio hippocampi]CAH0528910.1 hypothetical protein VHP8226_02940 [Vibrio hippocampi]